MNTETTRYRIPVMKVSLVKDGNFMGEVKAIQGPKDAASLIRGYLAGADREHLVVLLLDTKNKVIGINTVSIGDLSSAIVHPREVFKPAVIIGAAGIILGHNHPSGDCTPSAEDKAVTRRIHEAGQILGIELLDHIVVGDDCHASLKEQGAF